MGIEPFLVSSSLRAIIAQRLVRTLCPACRERYTPNAGEGDQMDIVHSQRFFYRPTGCEACMQSGYKGRTGIFEFLKLSENLQSLILKTSEANQIRQAAVEEGMKTLRQAGIEQALQGKTSFDEVLRVTQE
jgi:general secretion pathway protein E